MAFRVLHELWYADKRVEPGEIVDDIPARSVKWLLADGLIEKVDDQ